MIDCIVKLPNLKLELNLNYVKEENKQHYFYAEYKFEDIFSEQTVKLFNNLGILQHVRGGSARQVHHKQFGSYVISP